MIPNKRVMKESLIQACEDIKNSADEIVGGIDELDSLTVSIKFVGSDFPIIHINKDYDKYVTCTEKIQDIILKEF